MIPIDPVYSVIMKDGTKLTLPMSSDGTADAIASLAPDDERGWDGYFDYMNRFLDAAFAGGFFRSPTNTLADFADLMKRSPGPSEVRLALLCAAIRVWWISSSGTTASARRMASSPTTPGCLRNCARGTWRCSPLSSGVACTTPGGGMGAIPEALRRLGEGFGMGLRLDACVDRIMLSGRRAAGVVLTDGTQITADLVVSDINAKTLYLGLIGEENLPWLQRTGIQEL